jgi:hypothetical protein
MKKYVFFLIFTAFAIAPILSQNTISVPAGQTVDISYPNDKTSTVMLQTVGLQEVTVSVVTKDTGDFVRGFGLGKLGKEEVWVEEGNKLTLKNTGTKDIKVKYTVSPRQNENLDLPEKYIQFTLRNSSMQSIPLIIPTVMNPNLSPNSNSGVSLKMGQEIFFKANGKRQILLVVDQTIQNGDVIDVSKILPRRKKELGIK